MSHGIYEFKRNLKIEFTLNPIKQSAAVFLWGARQVGKTTLLKQQFPHAKYYDLLDTDLVATLTVRPKILREQILGENPEIVIIDEVQKIPSLLEEVHWLLENTATKFVLCGSSARKLKRKATNLLGGRASLFELFPLNTQEIPDFELDKYLNDGGLPVHYLLSKPSALLKGYINTYLKEEIIDEALTRNVPSFSRFLEVVALTHGQQLNYSNVAREAGVSASTVRNYFQILKDTLLGFELEPWRKAKNRRLVETAKFYLFDIGVANYLNPNATKVVQGSDLFGRAFEHFLINEIKAYISYNGLECPLSFWRTTSGYEVDLILGNMELALEFKSSIAIRSRALKGLRVLHDEFSPKKSILVCNEPGRTVTEDGIEIIFWKDFCTQLWNAEII